MVALLDDVYATLNSYSSGAVLTMLMLRRTEMSSFGLYFNRSIPFVRHLENLESTSPQFNDIFSFPSDVTIGRFHCIKCYSFCSILVVVLISSCSSNSCCSKVALVK